MEESSILREEKHVARLRELQIRAEPTKSKETIHTELPTHPDTQVSEERT